MNWRPTTTASTTWCAPATTRKAAVELQETFVRLSGNKSQNWLTGLFATHPPSQERVDANRARAAGMPGKLFRGEEIYRQKIAGLLKTRPAYLAHDEGRKLLEKEPEKALAKADEALRLEPREGLFHALRGDALKRLGRVAEAEREYDEAIKRQRRVLRPLPESRPGAPATGQPAGAQADLERANTLLPTAAAHYVLGNLAQGANNPGKAIEHYRQAAGLGFRGRPPRRFRPGAPRSAAQSGRLRAGGAGGGQGRQPGACASPTAVRRHCTSCAVAAVAPGFRARVRAVRACWSRAVGAGVDGLARRRFGRRGGPIARAAARRGGGRVGRILRRWRPAAAPSPCRQRRLCRVRAPAR
jgi:hypothetical protein